MAEAAIANQVFKMGTASNIFIYGMIILVICNTFFFMINPTAFPFIGPNAAYSIILTLIAGGVIAGIHILGIGIDSNSIRFATGALFILLILFKVDLSQAPFNMASSSMPTGWGYQINSPFLIYMEQQGAIVEPTQIGIGLGQNLMDAFSGGSAGSLQFMIWIFSCVFVLILLISGMFTILGSGGSGI